MKYDVNELQAQFRQGRNITELLRLQQGTSTNSATSILYAYDLQAGSYSELMNDARHAGHKAEVGKRLAAILDALAPGSILDAGIGEATTTVSILNAMRYKPARLFGLDLSLSRLLYARRNLVSSSYENAELFVGDIGNVALSDAAVDVVVTMHAVEPNHGREEPILKELLRVAGRALVMVEPSWELGSAATRARIERHRYVRGLPDILARLGYPAQRVEKWGADINPENEAALIVVDKGAQAPRSTGQFVSPISRRPLARRADCWFCGGDGHAFPIIAGIPCLTIECAILASKLETF
jgi:SAM-dependent methyltransferase